MSQVMKVLKSKYDTEIETKKHNEEEIAQLRERLAKHDSDIGNSDESSGKDKTMEGPESLARCSHHQEHR